MVPALKAFMIARRARSLAAKIGITEPCSFVGNVIEVPPEIEPLRLATVTQDRPSPAGVNEPTYDVAIS